VLCSLEQESGVAVLLMAKFCLAFSGFMLLSRQLGTLKKNKVES
jgi:hypothetical protein